MIDLCLAIVETFWVSMPISSPVSCRIKYKGTRAIGNHKSSISLIRTIVNTDLKGFFYIKNKVLIYQTFIFFLSKISSDTGER